MKLHNSGIPFTHVHTHTHKREGRFFSTLLGIFELKSKLKTLKVTAVVLGSACTELPAGSGLSFGTDRVMSSRT